MNLILAQSESEPRSQPEVNPDGKFSGQVVLITGATSGAVNTPMRRQAYESQGLSPNEPLPAPPNIQNRANTPEEMADIVMLLASTDVSYVLGTDIDVTTGMLTGLLTV